MPVLKVQRYFFDVRSSDHEDDDRDGTLLSDNAAALNYADRLIRELKEVGRYNDPNLMVCSRRDEEGCALDTFPCSARLMVHPCHVEYAHGTDQRT
jgi:hypothetical protein